MIMRPLIVKSINRTIFKQFVINCQQNHFVFIPLFYSTKLFDIPSRQIPVHKHVYIESAIFVALKQRNQHDTTIRSVIIICSAKNIDCI